MRTGAKKTVDRFQERAYGYIKLQYQCIPLEFLLESLERTKPLFNVGYVIVGGKKKEFPVFLLRHKQLNVATRWFQSLIRLRKEVSLSQRIFNEIVEARYARRHVLTRRRDELFNTAVANRFNTRYIY
jgi:ribosomal protein S7